MVDPFLDNTPYVFASGQGDSNHADLINHYAAKGYRVISTVYNPEGSNGNEQIVVLMGLHS
jgi:hypothetical protein